jgi:hypothetical protein
MQLNFPQLQTETLRVKPRVGSNGWPWSPTQILPGWHYRQAWLYLAQHSNRPHADHLAQPHVPVRFPYRSSGSPKTPGVGYGTVEAESGHCDFLTRFPFTWSNA